MSLFEPLNFHTNKDGKVKDLSYIKIYKIDTVFYVFTAGSVHIAIL
jgi:hypothetical protein